MSKNGQKWVKNEKKMQKWHFFSPILIEKQPFPSIFGHFKLKNRPKTPKNTLKKRQNAPMSTFFHKKHIFHHYPGQKMTFLTIFHGFQSKNGLFWPFFVYFYIKIAQKHPKTQ
jgi:hypothetical protein